MPNKSMAIIVRRYPRSDGWYSTIEFDTASQYGHFILVDLNHTYLLKHASIKMDLLLLVDAKVILIFALLENESCW